MKNITLKIIALVIGLNAAFAFANGNNFVTYVTMKKAMCISASHPTTSVKSNTHSQLDISNIE